MIYIDNLIGLSLILLKISMISSLLINSNSDVIKTVLKISKFSTSILGLFNSLIVYPFLKKLLKFS